MIKGNKDNTKADTPVKTGKNIALKDFTICQNDVFIEIKKGDDVSKMDIPSRFTENLITEKVLKG